MKIISIRLYVIFLGMLFLTSCASGHHKLLYREKPAFYAYIFGDLQSNRIDIENNADVYATPASCQKIITALLAYKTFGSDYFYETKLYAKKNKGETQDLFIEFSGDPTLTSEDLIKLLTPMKNSTIKGKIILDASLFKTPAYSTNVMIGDTGTKYGQPVSSMNIDQNLINIKITPTRVGRLAKISNDSNHRINSAITTTSEQSSVKLFWDEDRIKAEGNINPNDNFLEFKLSPKKIDNYILYKIQRVMKLLKINGKVYIVRNKSQLPSNLALLNTVKSESLSNIMPPAMKKSDNLVFDSLYLKIVHSQNPDGIDDWSKGDKVIKLLINNYFSIDMEKALFVDGSGLSRYNRVQPRQLFALLKQGYAIKEFVTALPSPGDENSTLEYRSNLSNNIKAKTGSMLGINCSCGYIIKNKNPKVFVLMTNSFAPSSQEMVTVIDQFINKNT